MPPKTYRKVKNYHKMMYNLMMTRINRNRNRMPIIRENNEANEANEPVNIMAATDPLAPAATPEPLRPFAASTAASGPSGGPAGFKSSIGSPVGSAFGAFKKPKGGRRKRLTKNLRSPRKRVRS